MSTPLDGWPALAYPASIVAGKIVGEAVADAFNMGHYQRWFLIVPVALLAFAITFKLLPPNPT